jgi:hypothetical protein
MIEPIQIIVTNLIKLTLERILTSSSWIFCSTAIRPNSSWFRIASESSSFAFNKEAKSFSSVVAGLSKGALASSGWMSVFVRYNEVSLSFRERSAPA